MEPIPAGYEIVDFDELSPVACPCGQARRAFVIGLVVLAVGRAAAAVGSQASADVPGNWSDAVPMVAGAGQHFVALEGTPTGAGTKESPWDLVSALVVLKGDRTN
jgi:hypothetical protein